MRIAVSGTHCIGKTTLIEDIVKKFPHFKGEIEPYYTLLEVQNIEDALEPSIDSLIVELDHSILQLNDFANEKNIIFDRCPVDFIAYAMCNLDKDEIDIHDTALSERFPEIKEALDNLDMIFFLPISKETPIEYDEENPEYRKAADHQFKVIYRDDTLDIFPKYNHPRIIEITGDRASRLERIAPYLAKG